MIYDEIMKGMFSALRTEPAITSAEATHAACESQAIGAALGRWVQRHRKNTPQLRSVLGWMDADGETPDAESSISNASGLNPKELLSFQDWNQFCERWGQPISYSFTPELKVDGFDVHFPRVGVVFTIRGDHVTSIVEDDMFNLSPDELGGMIFERKEVLTSIEKVKIMDFVEDLVDRVTLPQ